MIGSDVTSARWKSSSNDSLSCLLALASPNCPISKPGFASWSEAAVASAGSTRSSTVASLESGGSGTLNWISAALPSSEICAWLEGA